MVSKAHIRATTKWEKKAYFKTTLRFPKDAEDMIRKAAKGNLNGYITQLVLKDCGYLDSVDNIEHIPFEDAP